jgi:hypothetical protein
MSTKMKRTLWCWLALSPLIVLVLFPFAIMLFTALKPADEVFVYPARWLPVHWQWSNFADMWVAANFGVALRNSVVISLLSMALALAVSLPAAYALARFPFKGRGLYRQFLLVTQMLSPILLVVGLFQSGRLEARGDRLICGVQYCVRGVDAVVVLSDRAARSRRVRLARGLRTGQGCVQGVPAAGRARHCRHCDLYVYQCVE